MAGGRLAGELLDDDWSQSAAGLTALAHPVRLLLVREVLLGAETVAALSELPSLGTSGQLYHHLRQLVSALAAQLGARPVRTSRPSGSCRCWPSWPRPAADPLEVPEAPDARMADDALARLRTR